MKTHQNMKNKEFYVSPETEVILITMEATVMSGEGSTEGQMDNDGEEPWAPIEGKN